LHVPVWPRPRACRAHQPSRVALVRLRQDGRCGISVLALLTAGLVAFAPAALAKGGGAQGSYSTGTHGKAAPGVQRDANGKIARSPQAKSQFQKSHPCPSTGKASGSCPGYVIDHVTPLKRGGADAPGNMQWQTKEAAKEKDRWE
jgi:hypothetical protein